MGDRSDQPGYGPPPGDRPWEPPAGASSGGPGGSGAPGGYTPGGYSPGGYTPGGYSPGGYSPGGYSPGGYAPVGYDPLSPPRVDEPPGGPWSPMSTDAENGAGSLIGRPPFVWLVVGAVLGLLATVVAGLFGASISVAFGAWVLAGPVAIGLLAVYQRLDVRQRARPIYDAPSWIPALYWSTIAAAALGIGFSAWNIAEWAGRL